MKNIFLLQCKKKKGTEFLKAATGMHVEHVQICSNYCGISMAS